MELKDLDILEYDLGVPPVLEGRLIVEGIEDFEDHKMPLSFYLKHELDRNPKIRKTRTSPEAWGIYSLSRTCLNKKTGTFDYEPLPSNRDDEYYAEHRFKTAQEALDYYVEWCKKEVENVKNKMAG